MDATADPNWPCVVFSNHDQVRSVTRYGRGLSDAESDARARMIATLLLLTRGTPFLYYGEEIGLPEGRLSRSEIRDPVGLRYWPFNKGRDGARTPMAWTSGPQAGFTTGRPWLPIHPEARTRNVEAQRADPGSLWNWHRRILELRKAHTAFQTGAWEPFEAGHRDVLAFRRSDSGGAWLVLIHCGRRPAPVLIDGPHRWVLGTKPRDDLAPGLHVLDGSEVAILHRLG